MAAASTPQSGIVQLVRLSRAGDFAAARRYWDENLASLQRGYDRDIAYIDCLRRQNAHGDIEDFITAILQQQSIPYSDAEQQLLRLNLAHARLSIHGALRFAIDEARRMLLRLKGDTLSAENEYHVKAVDLYFRIIKYGRFFSTFTTDQDLELPGIAAASDAASPWTSFRQWFQKLCDAHWDWEALALLNQLSAVTSKHEVLDGFARLLADSQDRSQAQDGVALFHIAAGISRSRFLTSQKEITNGEAAAISCRTELEQFQQHFQYRTPRQTIELQLALLETQPESVEMVDSYERIALLAQESMDFGYEDYILDARARLTVKMELFDKHDQCQIRLQYVQSTLKRDRIAVLQTRCGSWRANFHKQRGDLLDFFNHFDVVHPFASLDQPPSPLGWDAPAVRGREQSLKYYICRGFGMQEQALAAMKLANTLLLLIPVQEIQQALAIEAPWLLEWSTPLSNESLPIFDVLANRMRLAVASSQHDTPLAHLRQFFVSDTNVSSNLTFPSATIGMVTSAQIQGLLFPQPVQQDAFLHRMALLGSWFKESELFSPEASDNLLAELYRQRIFAEPSSGNMQADLQDIETNTASYVEFVQTKAHPSVRRFLEPTLLRAKEAPLVMSVKLGGQHPQFKLLNILASMDTLLEEYRTNEKLAGNLSAQAILLGWSAVVALQVGDEDDFERRRRKAQECYDELRAELAALDKQIALEANASLREILGDNPKPLDRSLDELVKLYFRLAKARSEDQRHLGKIGGMIWDVVQESKNRALNDQVAQASDLPPKPSVSKVNREALNTWHEQVCNVREARKAVRRATDGITALERERRKLHDLESDLAQDSAIRESLVLHKGKAVNLAEMRTTAKEAGLDKLVLVDWFVASTDIPNKMHLIVVRISSEGNQDPVVFELLGMGRKCAGWVSKYLMVSIQVESLSTPSAYYDLQALQGLVQPLAQLTSPQDTLVFCPTTAWGVHRLPLHALELSNAKVEYSLQELQLSQLGQRGPSAGAQPVVQPAESEEETRARYDRLLLFRNEIRYTYSHSLLRLSLLARTNVSVASSNVLWAARSLSPLASAELRDESYNAVEDIASLFSPASVRTTTGDSVTLGNVEAELDGANFVYFFGHVHPAAKTQPNARPRPLTAHWLLYAKEPKEDCNDPSEHAANEVLTGERIISNVKLAQGAHVMMVSCGGGVTSARVTDDVLGLVPALFVAGARSSTAALWDVRLRIAPRWTSMFCDEWRDAVESTAHAGIIDVAACTQAASKRLCDAVGLERLGDWAGWVHYGFWEFRIAQGMLKEA